MSSRRAVQTAVTWGKIQSQSCNQAHKIAKKPKAVNVWQLAPATNTDVVGLNKSSTSSRPAADLRVTSPATNNKDGMEALVGVGMAAAGAATAVVAAPAVVAAVGFGTVGIAAGSVASGMMSASAIVSGGGVVAGGAVAVLQSAGAGGAGLVLVKGVAAATGAAVGAGAACVAAIVG